MGDRVGTTDGIPLGDVFNGGAVGDGDGSMGGIVLSIPVVGGTECFTVGINVGVSQGRGPAIKDRDPYREGVGW